MAAEKLKVEQLQAKLKEYVDVFEKLKKQARAHATVLRVRPEKVVLLFGNAVLEVEHPKLKNDEPALAAGDTVSVVGDTKQIFEVVRDCAVAAGEVCQVTRVVKFKAGAAPTCEVDRAGTSRAVTYDGVVEEGDRVVLDQAGMVVVSNLGKPPNECVVAEPTGVCWDDVGGLEEAKRQLREAIEAPTKMAGLLAKYRKKAIKGVLLYGPPGCGKTMLGKAAATALADLHGDAAAGAFFYVKGPELLNMYVGNSEAGVRKLFDAARRHKKKTGFPSIVFIDEADAILGKRASILTSALSATMVPAFLAEMDGLEDSGALVLLATNRPNTLDPAVVRDGRIDRRIRIARPGKAESREILLKHLRGRPLAMSEAEAADALVERVFDERHVVAVLVRAQITIGGPDQGIEKSDEHFTLGHMASGALLAGVVERAASLAIEREFAGGEANILERDLSAAVAESCESLRDVNHDDDVADFIEGREKEFEKIRRVARRQGPVDKTAN
jgi:proteasome ATPase